MNLVEEVNLDYFAHRFRNCFFMGPDNQPMLMGNEHTRSRIQVHKLKGEITKVTTEQDWLPHDFFTSLSVFAVPPLGWRSANSGRYLTFFHRNNRSYTRGVSSDNLIQRPSPLTEYLFDSDNLSRSYYDNLKVKASLILKPEYTELSAGVEQMRRGEVLSFCVSPNLAVVPGEEEKLAIYFNEKQVGAIEQGGGITCDNPSIRTVIEGYL